MVDKIRWYDQLTFLEPGGRASPLSRGALQAVQADLRAAGSPFAAPEYWSGDASNGTYASLQEASAPPVKMGERWQKQLKATSLRELGLEE